MRKIIHEQLCSLVLTLYPTHIQANFASNNLFKEYYKDETKPWNPIASPRTNPQFQP